MVYIFTSLTSCCCENGLNQQITSNDEAWKHNFLKPQTFYTNKFWTSNIFINLILCLIEKISIVEYLENEIKQKQSLKSLIISLPRDNHC